MWAMNEVRVSYLSPASMLQTLLIRFWIHSILKDIRDFVLVRRANLCKSLADGKQDSRSEVKREETDQVMGQIEKGNWNKDVWNSILQYYFCSI